MTGRASIGNLAFAKIPKAKIFELAIWTRCKVGGNRFYRMTQNHNFLNAFPV
jgi:hypothetical protein